MSSTAGSGAGAIVTLLVGVAAGSALGYLASRYLLSSTPTTVKHVFLGKFKDGTTEEDLKKLIAGYTALPKTIKSMKAFEWGTNVSLEGLDKGFTHIFVTTFENQQGVNHYLKHEDHIKYAQEILGHVADVVVVDYTPTVIL